MCIFNMLMCILCSNKIIIASVYHLVKFKYKFFLEPSLINSRYFAMGEPQRKQFHGIVVELRQDFQEIYEANLKVDIIFVLLYILQMCMKILFKEYPLNLLISLWIDHFLNCKSFMIALIYLNFIHHRIFIQRGLENNPCHSNFEQPIEESM